MAVLRRRPRGPGGWTRGRLGRKWTRSAAPGRRGQGRADHCRLHRAARWCAAGHLLRQTGKTRWEQLGRQDVQRWMIHRIGPLQRRLRQHPVPDAAAVLQVAGRRGRPPRPHDRDAGISGQGASSAGLHQRRTIPPGGRLPGRKLCPAPRRRDHRHLPRPREKASGYRR